jgi:hypothetical protein
LDGKKAWKCSLEVADLVRESLDDKDPDVVALVVGGMNEEAGTVRLVAEGRTDKFLAVLEDDKPLHLHRPVGWHARSEQEGGQRVGFDASAGNSFIATVATAILSPASRTRS